MRIAAPVCFLFALSFAVTCGRMPAAAEDAGKIMRRADRSWYQGSVDVVATAESDKLLLDAAAIPAEPPFPNVFHTTRTVPSGLHTVTLTWAGGKKEVQFFVGARQSAGRFPGAPRAQFDRSTSIVCLDPGSGKERDVKCVDYWS